MSNRIVDRNTWLKSRAGLLEKEKAFTRARAELAATRRELPWVKVEKTYVFQTLEGEKTLADLFLDRSQLAVYHLMFGPGWSAPCPGCTQWANALDRTTGAFAKADARLIAVSRAPLDEIAVQKEKLGWSFSWVSSHGSDFNFDYHASAADTEGTSYERIGGEAGERVGFDRGENHGVSVFCRDEDGTLYHTYSAYNRGIEELNGAFGYFDLLPKGRAW
jgi:predicted dithiol-disulfide oxidoreductase (DUF899 family)